jgi:type IV secretion system coupling TraD/TrwB family protein
MTKAKPFIGNQNWLVLGTRHLLADYANVGEVPWGISHAARRNHLYVVGKTGMGKNALLRNIILADIWRGAGVGVIDPHGDLAEDILDYIPPGRSDDVVYFNPSDLEYPLAWNPIQGIPADARAQNADFLVDAIKSIFAESWGPRLEFILYHAIRACMDGKDTTLLSVYTMLTHEHYRDRIVRQVKDPLTRDFWQRTFVGWPERYRLEAVGAIENKLGRFFGSVAIRNILGQETGKLSLDFIINNQRIFIANLSKGALGPDHANLLGSLLVSQFQAAAFQRETIPEEERIDFNLTIDEFQNFMTESFASVLSEARKYRLNLTMAHQYLGQAKPVVRDAVFGNAGSIVAFRVGGPDSEFLEKVLRSQMLSSTLFLGLKKHEVIASIPDGAAAPVPFIGHTLAPREYPAGRKQAIVALSREKYARSRSIVEPRVNALFSDPAAGKSPPLRAGVALRKIRRHTTGSWRA